MLDIRKLIIFRKSDFLDLGERVSLVYLIGIFFILYILVCVFLFHYSLFYILKK